MTDVLVQQLGITWSLATEWCLPRVTQEVAHWRPSSNAVGLEPREGGLFAQMPAEEEPIPDVTCAWLLWHVEWWWSNAVRGVAGDPARDPGELPWSGTPARSRARITDLHDEWLAIITTTDMDHPCSAPWPEPRPLGLVAGWVNIELMKNVAELGQLVRLHANRRPAG